MDKNLLIKQGWLRALLFFFISALVSGIITSLIETLIFKGYFGTINSNAVTLPYLFMSYCINQIGILVCIWFFRTKIDRDTVFSLGLQWKNYSIDALVGFAVAVIVLLVGTALLVIGNQVVISEVDIRIDNVALSFLLYLTVAMVEELMIRGYVLNNLMQSMRHRYALLISSFAFSMLHLGNPEITPLALVNIFIAGLLLGINYMYTKNLWFGVFLHFAWNFFQGPILGFPVSGTQKDMGILKHILYGPDLITGGDFGFEASLFSPILQLIAVIVLAIFYEKREKKPVQKPNEEVAETEQTNLQVSLAEAE